MAPSAPATHMCLSCAGLWLFVLFVVGRLCLGLVCLLPARGRFLRLSGGSGWCRPWLLFRGRSPWGSSRPHGAVPWPAEPQRSWPAGLRPVAGRTSQHCRRRGGPLRPVGTAGGGRSSSHAGRPFAFQGSRHMGAPDRNASEDHGSSECVRC